MGERQFTEQQVADIIRRAAEAQPKLTGPGNATQGLINASEVKRIAQELGIASDAVDRAIEDTSNWTATDSGSLNSVDRTMERRVEGELADEDYSAVLEEFVPSSGPGGQSISVGSTLNYKAMAGLAECNVNVSKKSGWTNLRVKSSAFLALLPTMIPALLATVVSGGIVWESRGLTGSEKLMIHAAILIAVWGLATWAFRSAVRSSNRKIKELMDRTATKMAELSGGTRTISGARLLASGAPVEETEQELRLQD